MTKLQVLYSYAGLKWIISMQYKYEPIFLPLIFSIGIDDELVKSQFWPVFVIPAKAGIQLFKHVIDSRLRGNDRLGDFLRERQ